MPVPSTPASWERWSLGSDDAAPRADRSRAGRLPAGIAIVVVVGVLAGLIALGIALGGSTGPRPVDEPSIGAAATIAGVPFPPAAYRAVPPGRAGCPPGEPAMERAVRADQCLVLDASRSDLGRLQGFYATEMPQRGWAGSCRSGPEAWTCSWSATRWMTSYDAVVSAAVRRDGSVTLRVWVGATANLL